MMGNMVRCPFFDIIEKYKVNNKKYKLTTFSHSQECENVATNGSSHNTV
jgi:hypothetical protein